MNEARAGNTADLVRLDPGTRLTPMLAGMMISNGLAWSPDGGTMYHADTEELARFPQSGGVFAREVHVPGPPEPMYAG